MSIHAFTSVTHRRNIVKKQLGGGRGNFSSFFKKFNRKKWARKRSRNKSITSPSSTDKTKLTKKQKVAKVGKKVGKALVKEGVKTGMEIGTSLAIDQLMNSGQQLTPDDLKRTAAHASLNVAENVLNGTTGSPRQHITSGLKRAKPGKSYNLNYYGKKTVKRARKRSKSAKSLLDLWKTARRRTQANRANLYNSKNQKFAPPRLFGSGKKKPKKKKKKTKKKKGKKGKKVKRKKKVKKQKKVKKGKGIKMMNIAASKRRQDALRDIFTI